MSLVRPRRRAPAFRRDRSGTAALEFAVVAPTFLLFLFAILGVALDGFYQLDLDDAVRNASRQLQINGPAATSGAAFTAAVCSQFGLLGANCTTTLTYHVVSSTVANGFTPLTLVSVPASGSLDGVFQVPGAYTDNTNYLIEVAYPLPFALPYVSQLITNTGTGSILAVATARAEPF